MRAEASALSRVLRLQTIPGLGWSPGSCTLPAMRLSAGTRGLLLWMLGFVAAVFVLGFLRPIALGAFFRPEPLFSAPLGLGGSSSESAETRCARCSAPWIVGRSAWKTLGISGSRPAGSIRIACTCGTALMVAWFARAS